MYNEVFRLHSELLKAMSHPKRVEIVHLLRESEMSVTQMQEMLDLPQANLSQHLQVLRDAGVVKTRRNGKQVHYSLAHKNFVQASDLMREILIERYKDTELADEFTMRMSELVPLTDCPVCHMRLSPKTAAFADHFQDQDYYFCASGCYEMFKKSPKRYTGGENG